MSLYSIVVPVYNSEKTLEELYTRIRDVFDHTMKENFELILVDDSSRDNSYEVMEKLHKADSRVKIIQMAKILVSIPLFSADFLLQRAILSSLWMMIFSIARKKSPKWLLL